MKNWKRCLLNTGLKTTENGSYLYAVFLANGLFIQSTCQSWVAFTVSWLLFGRGSYLVSRQEHNNIIQDGCE